MSLEKPCTFLLTKEKTWKCILNTNSELLQNLTEKQVMPSKITINRLLGDICYLFIACFDWKVGIFQQTFVRVYCILSFTILELDQYNFLTLQEYLDSSQQFLPFLLCLWTIRATRAGYLLALCLNCTCAVLGIINK